MSSISHLAKYDLFHVSVQENRIDLCLYFLLEVHLDPYFIQKQRNAFHIAAHHGHVNLLLVLWLARNKSSEVKPFRKLNASLLLQLKDNLNNTAKDYAIYKKDQKMLQVLAYIDQMEKEEEEVEEEEEEEEEEDEEEEKEKKEEEDDDDDDDQSIMIAKEIGLWTQYVIKLGPYLTSMSFAVAFLLSLSILYSMERTDGVTQLNVVSQIIFHLLLIYTKSIDARFVFKEHEAINPPSMESLSYTAFLQQRQHRYHIFHKDCAAKKNIINQYIEYYATEDQYLQTHMCHLCRIVRPQGTRHSRVTNKCIEDFDHYCVFLGMDVGGRTTNYIPFFITLSFLVFVTFPVAVLTYGKYTHVGVYISQSPSVSIWYSILVNAIKTLHDIMVENCHIGLEIESTRQMIQSKDVFMTFLYNHLQNQYNSFLAMFLIWTYMAWLFMFCLFLYHFVVSSMSLFKITRKREKLM
jgi:hypothetical protein